jgi:SAM-dependent methyltransferase
MPNTDNLLREVADYYTGKLRTYGTTSRGVDWSTEEGQNLRFAQLCRLLSGDAPCSLHDIGCGYGALLRFLSASHPAVTYQGWDISEEMILAARAAAGVSEGASFHVGASPDTQADYCVASGIFNVRLSRGDEEWLAYMTSTLDVMDRASTKGFAFNCLTSYSDEDRKRPDLYYADPGFWFDLCKRKYARNVALLHDYDLYEFTILVRK